jgi:hypothetical protein
MDRRNEVFYRPTWSLPKSKSNRKAPDRQLGAKRVFPGGRFYELHPSLRSSALVFLILIAYFSIGCNRNPNPQNNMELLKAEYPKTGGQKLLFPGLTPEPYRLPIDEPTFIRVVTNSTQMQEVWMVYYDYEAQKWENPPLALGKGSGEKNHVIGDIKFEKRSSFSKYKNETPPEFYMRYILMMKNRHGKAIK